MLKKTDFKNRLKNINVKTPEEIKKWEKKNKEVAVAPTSASTMVLDLFKSCDDDSAAMPNSLSRSALFAPIARGRRRFIDNELIASRHDVSIRYEGKQLDVSDADVFMQAIKLADQCPLSTEFQILPYAFLKKLGRSGTGKKNKEWLMHSLERLKKGNITIKTKKYTVILSLIDEYIYNENTKTHYLKFNSKIITLFRQEQYGLIDWKKRKNIKKEISLAKWLQTYIASNARGQQKISIEKLQKWSGKEKRQRSKFKNSLKKAFKELEKLKIIKNFNINIQGIVTYIRL